MKEEKKVSLIVEEVQKRFSEFKNNRQTLEEKWNRNYDLYARRNGKAWKGKDKKKKDWQSDTNLGIGKAKITSALALCVHMILHGGKYPFNLKVSPWSRVVLDEMAPEEARKIDQNRDKMEKLIQQQLIDCKADRVKMKNFLAAAIYGETYSKKNVYELVRKGYRQIQAPEGMQVQDQLNEQGIWEKYEIRKNAPGILFVSTWDIFTDLEHDNINEGVGIIHRQEVSPYWLRSQKGKPLFLDKNIDTVLDGDSTGRGEQDTSTLSPALRNLNNRSNQIQYLEWWGRLSESAVKDWEKNNGEKSKEVEADKDKNNGKEVECMVCIAGDEVVRFARTTPEDRPFFRAVWEENLDGLGGISVADNTEPMNNVMNGAFQTFEDNKKLVSNLIIAIKARFMDDEFKEIEPGKIIPLSESCTDARQAIQPVTFPDVGDSVISFMTFAERFLDDGSLLPKITQGISTNTPQTAYEISVQNDQSGKYMGLVARNFDEGMIEPEVAYFLDYNMMDPEVKDGKGDYIVNPMGYAHYQNRAETINALNTVMSLLVSNQEFTKEAKFRTLIEDIFEMLELDGTHYLKSEEEKADEVKQTQQMMQAEQQKQEQAMQLEMQEKSANIAKAQSDIQLNAAKIAGSQAEQKLDKVKLIADIEKNHPKPVQQELPLTQEL